MIRAGLPSLLALALLAEVGACERREIVIFAANHAGSAGENAIGGSGGGGSGGAGTGGAGTGGGGAPAAGFAGSLSPAGSGGLSGAGGGGGNSVDKPCQSSRDCDQAWFCQKQTCADPWGVCNPRPLDDDLAYAEVCGCESITYWNDTIRQQHRNPASTKGACTNNVTPCRNDRDCAADPAARCVRALDNLNACPTPGTGQCWVVPSPDECSAGDYKAQFLPCPPPGGAPAGSLPPCLTLCQVINYGIPFAKKAPDYICP